MRKPTSRVAAVIGHDKNSAGYYSKILGSYEYPYNSELATYLNCADIFKRPLANGYNKQMELLAAEIDPMGYDLAAELHFNGFDNKANNKGVGCEAVIYPNNEITKAFGERYCEVISKEYDIPNRGVKERSSGRGVGFLTKLKTNTIILEPFFGDEMEAEKFKDIEKHGRILNKLFLEFLEK